MQQQNFLDEVRKFRNNKLKPVTTTVTTCDGQQYIETFKEGKYALQQSGLSAGYVIDSKADITVAYIMDGLILGSQDVAAELKVLEKYKVTHILNVGYKISNHFQDKFIYKNVEILDNPSTDIRMFFDTCFKFINDGRQKGCVLIHCNAGISRAPTIVVAYLMKKYHISLQEALSLVKSVRSCIKPNDGFMNILKVYEKDILHYTKTS